MNKYQCQVCGAVSYSAASQENLKDNSCLECDGRVEMVDWDKMNADEIVKKIRSANICDIAIARMEAADLIESLQAQLAASQRRAQDARNELCLKCGRYRESHNGACDRCRWKENEP